jgi:hypothetical protein
MLQLRENVFTALVRDGFHNFHKNLSLSPLTFILKPVAGSTAMVGFYSIWRYGLGERSALDET